MCSDLCSCAYIVTQKIGCAHQLLKTGHYTSELQENICSHYSNEYRGPALYEIHSLLEDCQIEDVIPNPVYL